jgi:hypothetical protein
VNIEEFNGLHNVVHLKAIKLEKPYEKVGDKQLRFILLELVDFILVLDVGYDHENKSIGADAALVRR